MFYEVRLTIPKNTSAAAPVSTVIYIHPGTVKQIEIIFPHGCVGLVHAQLFYESSQVWPSNINSDFAGDDVRIVFNEDYEIKSTPFEIGVKGWNEDDTYPHTVTVRLQITTAEKTLLAVLQSFILGPRRG